ncbi:MAG: hypothetical protein JST84_17205 [Acidobacteria bacterium]|nr:hypothetical protein [Acidobacteriota bacterium]
MKLNKHRALILSSLAAVVITSSVFAMWAVRPEVKVVLTGTVERENQAIEIDKAGLLNPGEVLNWTILSHNAGNAPAHNYKTVGEIPQGTAYVGGSAKAGGNATIFFSIDQGKTYSTKPTIEQKQPDGSYRQVPAPATMYTHIRYEWNDPLNEGKQVSAMYKVRVK